MEGEDMAKVREREGGGGIERGGEIERGREG